MVVERVNLALLFKLKREGNKSVIKWCRRMGLIAERYECPRCGGDMILKESENETEGYIWICKQHKEERSIRLGTWFNNSKLSIINILLMTEFFVYKRTLEDVMYELGLSKEIVCDWHRFYREVCMKSCISKSRVIGGKGVTVEFFYYKGIKDRYERESWIGQWMFVGIEKKTSKFFLQIVENKDPETVIDIVKTWILPKSIIISDCWDTFESSNEIFNDLGNNHSILFHDFNPKDKFNLIDRVRQVVKRSLAFRSMGEIYLDTYLAEYIWQRCHKKSSDLMRTFLEDVRYLYPPHENDMQRRNKRMKKC